MSERCGRTSCRCCSCCHTIAAAAAAAVTAGVGVRGGGMGRLLLVLMESMVKVFHGLDEFKEQKEKAILSGIDAEG